MHLQVRVSPSYYNTEAEVDAVLAAIREILIVHAPIDK
jgi:selenocysteine lyase/cysteine desulfurase